MDVHRYNSRTGFIDKTHNLTAENADKEFAKVVLDMRYDMFSKHYRVTLFDPMRNTIIKDSDFTDHRRAIS